MVSRRSRSIFAVLLAFALLPIISMARGVSEAGARSSVACLQGQAKSPVPVQGVRSDLGELAKRHADATPFAPAEVFRLALSALPACGTASIQVVARLGAPVALHPARAPPTLS